MRFLLLCLLSSPLWAAETGGVRFPERWMLGKAELTLNGAGLREYGVMGIDIYAAALYLAQPESDAEKVLDSRTPKVLHMQFFRDVGREDTQKAWAYYFAQNCTTPCKLPTQEIAAFQAFIPDSRDGDTQTYEFYPDRVNVLVNGKRIGSVAGAGFVRLLLSTWIGRWPTTPELRAALLGR